MKARNYILIFLFLIILNFKSFGTAQSPDILIYNNDTVSMYSNPLEQLNNINTLRNQLFEDNEYHGHGSMSCSRGYRAEWTIIDSELYLTAIYSCNYPKDRIQANLQSLFGEKYSNGKVKADWVTAKILSPQGKQLYYVHSGYQSLYEKEVVFEIVKGALKGITTYDNSKSRESIYSENTALMNFIYSNIKWETLPKQDKPVRVVVYFSANEKGVIDSVILIRKFDDIYDKEAERVVKSIPRWDVFYRLGQHERLPWTLPIVFSDENRKKYKR